jgi:radical SAM superfamily enzyme YgiQ (UPF0313 family)
VIAFFTFLVWKVYERIAWLTGSMESHSNLMLQIEARRGIKDGEPIKVVWWDPTIGGVPKEREHGMQVDLDTIYVYLPEEMRSKHTTSRQKLKELFVLP